jgi:hypothetical protein
MVATLTDGATSPQANTPLSQQADQPVSITIAQGSVVR